MQNVADKLAVKFVSNNCAIGTVNPLSADVGVFAVQFEMPLLCAPIILWILNYVCGYIIYFAGIELQTENIAVFSIVYVCV